MKERNYFSNAEFLMTGDKDLLSLKSLLEYKNLIISPSDFLVKIVI